MNNTIAGIRRDYQLRALSEMDVEQDPLKQFGKWWVEALNSDIDEVNAMTLATASPDGVPSARIVLLKAFDEKGFTFFTNYNSFKGRQLAENPRVCLVFFWKELERQVRITGLAKHVDAQTSDEYFFLRPEKSRIAAVASPQSEVIASREWLELKVSEVEKAYKNKKIDRPPHWGGYLVRPVEIEFWQGRSSRLHDRLSYTIDESGNWIIERLAP